jgi:thioredoxin 1
MALIEVNDANFETEVVKSTEPVLVDFSAEWCGPCKRLAPVVEEIAAQYSGRLKVAHLDIDRAQATAARYGVMSVPTILFLKGGQVRDQIMGYVPKGKLIEKIERIL